MLKSSRLFINWWRQFTGPGTIQRIMDSRPLKGGSLEPPIIMFLTDYAEVLQAAY